MFVSLTAGPLLPLLGEVVWRVSCGLGDQEAYFAWVAAYQEAASSALAPAPMQTAYLAALAKEQELPKYEDGWIFKSRLTIVKSITSTLFFFFLAN
jgi:hypothetical protein